MPEALQVRVPGLGEFSDVEVVEIAVSAGDEVAAGDPLITLETDKAAMDVPSPVAGQVLALKVAVGDKVNEGDVIAELEDTGEPQAAEAEAAADKAAAPPAAAAPGAPARTAPAAQAPAAAQQLAATAGTLPPIDEEGFSKAHASPAVRKFARELGVNLAAVKGSGEKGRIRKADVKAWVKLALQQGAAGRRAAAGSRGGLLGPRRNRSRAPGPGAKNIRTASLGKLGEPTARDPA